MTPGRMKRPWRRTAWAAIPIMAVLSHSVPGGAQSDAGALNGQALDGTAIRDLALRGTWLADENWGYWSWGAGGSVCLRLFGPDGDCADTGAWTVDGDVLCYELTWWGEGHGVWQTCVTVHALDGFHYETRFQGGELDSVFFTFILIE